VSVCARTRERVNVCVVCVCVATCEGEDIEGKGCRDRYDWKAQHLFVGASSPRAIKFVGRPRPIYSPNNNI